MFTPEHRLTRTQDLPTALYDAVATHLGVPIYSLLGEKHRDWIPCAAWTRPASPADLKVELRRAVEQGYMALKMHTSRKNLREHRKIHAHTPSRISRGRAHDPQRHAGRVGSHIVVRVA